MFRRIEVPRTVAPPVRRVLAVVGAALLVLLWPLDLAAADDEITVQPDEIIVAPSGSTTVVATEQVPADLIGKDCALKVIAENGSSVHPGNALIVTTGGAQLTIEGVEDQPNGQVIGQHQVVLGETIVFELRMGSDGLSSLGFQIGIDCDPMPDPTLVTDTTAQLTVPELPEVTEAPPPTVLGTDQTRQEGEVTPLPEAPPANSNHGEPTYTG